MRAEQFFSSSASALVSHTIVQPTRSSTVQLTWLDAERFWYRVRVPAGIEFVLVNARTADRRPAFDHVRLAAALSVAADTSYEPFRLPFHRFDFLDPGRLIHVEVDSARAFACNIGIYRCIATANLPRESDREVKSPDGKWVAYTRAYNLWVRSLVTGEEIQLTHDGTSLQGYGVHTEGGGWDVITTRRSGRVKQTLAAWSPDSRRIATHRVDERGVQQFHLIEAREGRPILHSYRRAVPGDTVVPTSEILIIDVPARTKVKVQRPPQPEPGAYVHTPLFQDSIWGMVRWGANSDELFFTQGERSYRSVELAAADAVTGKVRRVVLETGPTYVEMNPDAMSGLPNWRVLNGNREAIWYSERDGWGHLYLYDARSGALKNRITSGTWQVADVLHIDEANRLVYFTGRGREQGRDPYFRLLYRAKLDGSRIELLTPEDAEHEIRVSPNGRYFVDTYSRLDTIPVMVLRGADGRVLSKLETGDASRLLAAGWRFPERVKVKARDGVTDIYGALFRPSNFDPKRKYPIIDYIYPGPQIGSLFSRAFQASLLVGNAQALAELGFFVVAIDAMGTPFRSKAFHDAYYGNMGDNGLPDQIAAIRRLAARYPQIDLDRVGIYGYSGGGYASTDAILRYPDFFKVAVSMAGNHDQRSNPYTWGEKYHGLLIRNPDGSDNYDSQANHPLAKNLKGKLLLMYGTLDDNTHPNATLLVVNELIKHNKNFDMLALPNRNHGFGLEPYVVRKTWDYFVKHLLGVEPPEVELKAPVPLP